MISQCSNCDRPQFNITQALLTLFICTGFWTRLQMDLVDMKSMASGIVIVVTLTATTGPQAGH